MKMPAQGCLLIIAAALVSACSPYIYKTEVSKFSSGVEEASKLVDIQREVLSKRTLDLNRGDLIDSGSPRLVVPTACSDAVLCMESVAFPTKRAQKCVAEITRSEVGNVVAGTDPYVSAKKVAIASCVVETSDGQKIEIPIQLPAQKIILDTLTDYSRSLAGIVEAEDRDALSESAAKACASTEQLYSGASGLNTNSGDESSKSTDKGTERTQNTGKAITAVCGLASQIGVGFLDRQRLKVLTQVVNEGDSRVTLLADYLAKQSRKMNSLVLRSQLEILNDTVEATAGLQNNEGQYLANIQQAITQKNDFVALLKSDSESVFQSMAEAHRKLKEAVNDPKRQLGEVSEAIDRFRNSAKEAHSAIKALSQKSP